MRILLVRHVSTVWNEEGRLQGHTDSPVSAEGERQLAGLRRAFEGRGVEAIYSSDSGRALRTAEVIAAVTGAEIQADPRLRERNYGEWEGLMRAQVRERQATRGGSADDPDFAPAGGESRRDRQRRVVAALEGILASGHRGEVVIVTHEGCLPPLLERLLGSYPRDRHYLPPNASITEVVVQAGGAKLVRLGDTGHLQ